MHRDLSSQTFVEVTENIYINTQYYVINRLFSAVSLLQTEKVL